MIAHTRGVSGANLLVGVDGGGLSGPGGSPTASIAPSHIQELVIERKHIRRLQVACVVVVVVVVVCPWPGSESMQRSCKQRVLGVRRMAF